MVVIAIVGVAVCLAASPLVEQTRIDHVLADFGDNKAVSVWVTGIQQDVERLRHHRRGNEQQR